MRKKLVRTAMFLLILGGTVGCSVFRPVLFWRETLIVGKATLADESGVPVRGSMAQGVTLNFIYVGGRIEESVLSATTDAMGKYRSPKLLPGRYKVEAFLPGYVIETIEVLVKSHEHKGMPIVLKKIRETKGKSAHEGQDDNIPNPGDVQIMPPSF
jgi:hypothetical protein